MVGIKETYLPAFVLALSSSQLAAGLVATVPLMAGALLQLISPYAVRRLRSYRLSILPLFNVANAMAIVTGSLIGGLLIGFLGAGPATYMILFAVSADSRMAALRLLVPIAQFSVGKLLIATRPIAIRPTTGPLERPVLASMETAGVGQRASEAFPTVVNLIEP